MDKLTALIHFQSSCSTQLNQFLILNLLQLFGRGYIPITLYNIYFDFVSCSGYVCCYSFHRYQTM